MYRYDSYVVVSRPACLRLGRAHYQTTSLSGLAASGRSGGLLVQGYR